MSVKCSVNVTKYCSAGNQTDPRLSVFDSVQFSYSSGVEAVLKSVFS